MNSNDPKFSLSVFNAGGSGEDVDTFIQNIDYVPSNMPLAVGPAKLCLLEDNEPVIKMANKRRWPQFRYVPRTQKIDLDWLFERISTDPGIRLRYINTKIQSFVYVGSVQFITKFLPIRTTSET